MVAFAIESDVGHVELAGVVEDEGAIDGFAVEGGGVGRGGEDEFVELVRGREGWGVRVKSERKGGEELTPGLSGRRHWF